MMPEQTAWACRVLGDCGRAIGTALVGIIGTAPVVTGLAAVWMFSTRRNMSTHCILAQRVNRDLFAMIATSSEYVVPSEESMVLGLYSSCCHV